jgi:hypothetical protein
MDATGFQPFKVWLGFIAPVVAVLLLVIVPGPPEEIAVEFHMRWANGSWQVAKRPVEDVSKMHPMMPVSAVLLAAGWAWWFFWLYRRHQQLAQLTNSTYPVRPALAVGMHFVPGLNLYWAFHWTRRFTSFCDLVQSGLLRPAALPGPESAGKPPAIFAGNMSGVSDDVKPGWLPGAFLCLAMVLAYGAVVPRNYLLRKLEAVPPDILVYVLLSLVIALAVAIVLDRRFVAAFASAASSSAAPRMKPTLGI